MSELNTINVIEIMDNQFLGMKSFTNNSEGLNDAINYYTSRIKEMNPHTTQDIIVKAIESGCYYFDKNESNIYIKATKSTKSHIAPKKYKIPVLWQMSGIVEIEAESLEDAVIIAKNDTNTNELSLPTDGDYISDSFEVDDNDFSYIESINELIYHNR